MNSAKLPYSTELLTVIKKCANKCANMFNRRHSQRGSFWPENKITGTIAELLVVSQTVKPQYYRDWFGTICQDESTPGYSNESGDILNEWTIDGSGSIEVKSTKSGRFIINPRSAHKPDLFSFVEVSSYRDNYYAKIIAHKLRLDDFVHMLEGTDTNLCALNIEGLSGFRPNTP